MIKIKRISTAILISAICALTAGCGGKTTVQETPSTALQNKNEGTESQGEATKSAQESTSAPENKTDPAESTQAPAETGGNSNEPLPTLSPSTPDANGFKLLEVEGFVGSNQKKQRRPRKNLKAESCQRRGFLKTPFSWAIR